MHREKALIKAFLNFAQFTERSTMAKESTFLMMWQIFFAIISVIAASQNVTLQNTSLQNPPSCPRNCSCSPCLHPANVPDLLAIQCSNVNVDDFTDLSFADKICSL